VSENTAAAASAKHRTITIDASPGRARATARVCEAASCMSGRSSDITARLAELTADSADISVKRVGCLGLCAAGPLVEIAETGELFAHVEPDSVEPIVKALKAVKPTAKRQLQGPFFEKQVRVATENFGLVDPESLEDYLAHGGYRALRRVLSEMTSAEVRDAISASGLRGRGGAGYPTGLKWTTVAKAAGDKK
jgi:bidirectional [NiFe] hydrogenase diaphorase subunit